MNEDFWMGVFGDDYTERNKGSLESCYEFWDRTLLNAAGIDSVLEFGANVGENLQAIKNLYGSRVSGVEINEKACSELVKVADQVFFCSMLDFHSSEKWDLTFTKGVLIHINPKDLPKAYEALYTYSKRYILIAEYFSSQPQEVEYRGHKGKLWKRDFCKDLLSQYPLTLVDYGFFYHTDDQDDINWFLLEK